MSEGFVYESQLQGFNRQMNFLDGNVKLGYFRKNSPYGKMIIYENGQFSD